jgi:2-dehydropantoate 2-reductase
MRQVPVLESVPLGIVGDGRVARHFSYYFELLGLPFRSWSRRVSSPSPLEALGACRTVLLLIRDSAIPSFVDAWPALRSKRLVHFSGSLVTPVAEGAHPLMSFGPALYDLRTYRAIPFAVDPCGTPLTELLPGLPNPSFAIAARERPYYHALCVMAGNFSTLLWQKLFNELETRFGVPASVAHPYLERLAANLLADAPNALTGPLSRGDAPAIAANLAALDGDPFRDVYAAFVRAYDQRS